MFQVEVLVFSCQQIRHDANHCICFVLVLLEYFVLIVRVAVHEAADWLEMTVDVAKHLYCAFFLDHLDELAHDVHLRVQPWRWLDPSAVHVEASQIGALVALNHAVRIEHRHHVKDELTAQLLGLDAVRQQEVDHAFESKRALRLSRVHSACNYHGLFALVDHQELAELGFNSDIRVSWWLGVHAQTLGLQLLCLFHTFLDNFFDCVDSL